MSAGYPAPSAATVPRRLSNVGLCHTNFYPLRFQVPGSSGGGPGLLQIRIFTCTYRDAESNEPILPREESELKARIFDKPRQEGWHKGLEDSLGVRCLVYGGDCAAGLVDARGVRCPDAPAALAVGEPDKYEVGRGGDWLPAVVREIREDGEVLVEPYARGSFWSERLGRSEPVVVPREQVRPRCWEVCRGEILRVPDGETLRLSAGQHFWVRPRGAAADEPAGRVQLGVGSGVRCEAGAAVENEGVLQCPVTLDLPSGEKRRFRLDLTFVKTILVDCLEVVLGLPAEERGVVLNCVGWILGRSYRLMRLKTLGGKGWYMVDQGERFPESSADTSIAPVYLYRGFTVGVMQVPRGTCLRVDLSVRMIQGQTALVKLNQFRDMLVKRHTDMQLPAPTQAEMDAFLQQQVQGLTCMTKHSHKHYKIAGVRIDMDPSSTFPFEESEISYSEYFQRRHGIILQRRQPMLQCHVRGPQPLYLPAEICNLTGFDEGWKGNRELLQELWQNLRREPTEHWRMQSVLVDGLNADDSASSLRECGVSLGSEPLQAEFKMLEHEPVYFDRYANEYFRRGQRPPVEMEVPTSYQGFESRPWPDVWTSPGQRLIFDRWLIFCFPQDRDLVDRFVEELEPLVSEVLEADLHSERILIAPPEIVEISAKRPEKWAELVRSHEPPWPVKETKMVLAVIPEKSRDQYYYHLKDRFSCSGSTAILSQVVLNSTLQNQTRRTQILTNLLQQMLVKRGAWLWVISPLPYKGRSVMAVGIDSCKPSREEPTIHVLSATTNPYFTTCFSTWRVTKDSGKRKADLPCPGPMMREALLHFFAQNKRLPDTLVVYRGGASESLESRLLEAEVYHPEEGILQTVVAVSEEVAWDAEELAAWKTRFEMAYIMVRRQTNVRYRTDGGDNLPSGSYVDGDIVPTRDDGSEGESKLFDFYMVSQTYVVGTAKPSYYSVLYNKLTLNRTQIIELSHRLCKVYQAFAGTVSSPAPLKYAQRLVCLLSKCKGVPAEPPVSYDVLKPWLFFI